MLGSRAQVSKQNLDQVLMTTKSGLETEIHFRRLVETVSRNLSPLLLHELTDVKTMLGLSTKIASMSQVFRHAYPPQHLPQTCEIIAQFSTSDCLTDERLSIVRERV